MIWSDGSRQGVPSKDPVLSLWLWVSYVDALEFCFVGQKTLLTKGNFKMACMLPFC